MITRVERIDLPSGTDGVDDSTLIERWRVWSDDAYDGPEQMLTYGGLPKIGAYYAIDNRVNYFFRVTDRDCEMFDRANKVAVIKNTYKSKVDIQELENKVRELSPLDRTPKVSRRYVEVDEPLIRDAITREHVRNTAGDPIVGLKTKRINVVYDLEGYFGYDPQFLEAINGCINKYQATIYGRTWLAHQLRFTLTSISPLQFERGQYYYTVKAQIVGDDRTWGHKQHLLNAGLREKDFLGGTSLIQCKINDREVTQPVPLDTNGYMISVAQLAANPITAPHYLDIAGFQEADFGIIGLPPTTYQPQS